MPHLIILQASSLVDVITLEDRPVSIGPDPAADRILTGAGFGNGTLAIARAGGSYELRADAGVALTVNGRESKKKVLKPGDRIDVAPFTLYFWSDKVTASRGEPVIRKKLLDALLMLARHCHAVVDSTSLFEGIIDCLLSLSGAERGFILVEGRAGVLEPAVSRGIDVARTDEYSTTVVERVRSTGQAVTIADASREPDLSGRASVKSMQIRSVLAVPLLKGKSPIGVVYLDCRARSKVFSPEDQNLLEAAAEHVVAALSNARAREELKRRADQLQSIVEAEVNREHGVDGVVGRSKPMRVVLAEVAKVAAQQTSTLILGESGTGKELIARTIHRLSPRAAGPFVAVNCMALSAELLESELFGHEKGAFTGATERRTGRFEVAQGGSIFLDEIGEVDAKVQIKLLRVLQERVYERVGSTLTHVVDTRLICATNVDLSAAIAKGRFREDLYYRIAVFPIRLPPLRARADDIPLLIDHFIRLLSAGMGKPIHGVSAEATVLLCRYHWPGNIRELRNVLERAFVLETSDTITEDSLPLDLIQAVLMGGEGAPAMAIGTSLAAAKEDFETKFIEACLRRHRNNVSRAARELDVPRSTIYRKLDGRGIKSGAGDEEV